MTEAMATYEACISDVAVEVEALPVHKSWLLSAIFSVIAFAAIVVVLLLT
jgi:hypothetical protein